MVGTTNARALLLTGINGDASMSVIESLRRAEYRPVEQTLSPQDAMLYGLALGFGSDPCDAKQLRFVYEQQLEVFPSMAITLCYPGRTEPSPLEGKLDPRQVLHVFQGFELMRPIPIGRALVGQHKTTGVHDKGPRGVLWTYENRVRERDSGALVCVLQGASMSRVGGVAADPAGSTPPPRALPRRPPDAVTDIPTLPQAALIYRLCGDLNPLHADPVLAREGGFPQPILHGRCTFGVAARAIVEALCPDEAGRLRAMEARFSAPVFPGETVRTEMWVEGLEVQFRCTVPERELVVLQHGFARLHDEARGPL
jgi:acyl dehydratase